MNENQIQLIIQERDLALEQYNQSKILIEKLEQELSTLKELQPTGEKNFVNIIQKEYSEVIKVLHEKLKSLQEKCKDEIYNCTRKDDEIRILTRTIDELNSRLCQIENQYSTCNNLLRQEREKYLALEKDYIVAQNELCSLKKKYSSVTILENERDKLIGENFKLSNDCNELEIALEICHQKIQTYEEEMTHFCEIMKQLQEEKKLAEKNEKAEKEMNNELEKRIREMNGSLKKLHDQVKTKDELFSKNVHKLVEHFSLDHCLKELHEKDLKTKEINSDDDKTVLTDFYKLQTLMSTYKNELHNCIKVKLELEEKLGSILINMEKYKEYIREANEMISILEKKLEDHEKTIGNKTSQNELQKYLQRMTNTNMELKKQIHSQEELHKKWKKEVADLITRFKNRIVYLNANYKKTQKENLRLKKYLNKYLLMNDKNDDSKTTAQCKMYVDKTLQ